MAMMLQDAFRKKKTVSKEAPTKESILNEITEVQVALQGKPLKDECFIINSFETLCEFLSICGRVNFPLWYRGQGRKYGDNPRSAAPGSIQAGIFRNPKKSELGEQKDRESSMNLLFRAKALTQHGKCPDREDLAGWLFLAQHFGMETRIVDWSEGALMALYFAAESIQKEKMEFEKYGEKPKNEKYADFAKYADDNKLFGVIYLLDPLKLNEIMLEHRLRLLKKGKYLQRFFDRKINESGFNYIELYKTPRILFTDHPEVINLARAAFNPLYNALHSKGF